jgi:uncharacterized membrane protein YhdT
MSEEPRTAAVEIEQEGTRRARMLHIFTLVGAGMAAATLVLFVVLGLLDPQFPLQYAAPLAVVFILIALFSLWLSQRGHLRLAIGVYLVNMTVGLFVASYFINGVSGPLVIALISVTVMTGLLEGRKAARWIALSIAALYLAMTILEALGVSRPREITGVTSWVVESTMFLAVLAMTVVLVETFVGLTQRALSLAQQRGRELAEASRQAQQAAQAEREAREREEGATQRLRQVVQKYTAFLERVMAGDYSAMLPLDEVDEGEEGARELRILGEYLNATVESLVTALSGMQILQQRYVRDAWESFAQIGAVHHGFRYHAPSIPRHARDDAGSGHGARVESDDEAWLTPMAKAVQDKDVTVSEQELALPITLRGQIIGAIGARREERTGWSEEDVALAQTIINQLAQTIENLRLLDETQRRAARERLTADITTRVRASSEVDTILQTAIRELGRALRASDGLIRLGTGDGVGSLQADKGVGDSENAST